MKRKARYEVRPAARRDVAQIADYIARRSPAAGRRFFGAAEKAFREVAKWPGFGKPVESDAPELANVRCASVPGFKNYLVIYRQLPDVVEILSVLHGARDLDSILGGGAD